MILENNIQDKAHTTFLVVDDNDLDFEKITRSFARLKIDNDVIRATDGIEALDLLRSLHARGEISPPIVLLDLNMPRMGGIEFLSELRSDEKIASTPVFILTTSDHPEDISKAHEFNVSGYIIKPLQRDQMLNALNTLNMFWALCEYQKH
ncbi:response regulator receiver domain-containing protein [Pacificibacter maritimus]|uniref:Response regulator receiver domain-containing protein n=1 Tax=Pacificibacter maritimus TaxID=762213 RepID=A0A3N4V0J3_9RHOB|nr:response regulator [Pacificibacter maritimus]RPE66434.1 response regulator receiver domain-containing protein [Pacificibacter maritimus]